MTATTPYRAGYDRSIPNGDRAADVARLGRDRAPDVARDGGDRAPDVARVGGDRAPDVARVGGDIGELVEDVSTLVELQFRLLAIDLKATARSAAGPLGMVLFGAVLLLGCIPVLLAGIAWLLVEQAGWSIAAALLTTAGGAAALAIAAAVAGGLLLRRSGASLERSRCELRENIRWIKAAFNRRRLRDRNPMR